MLSIGRRVVTVVAPTRRTDSPKLGDQARDDGEGFQAPENGAGQGLENMKTRADSIGGTFGFASAPGRGTALEVVLRA